jgi:hypothetical protein
MASDSVHIDPQQASNGLAQWDAGAQALTTGWAEKVAAIRQLNNAGTWGGDGPGEEFGAQYTESASQYLTVGTEVVAQVQEVGEHSRTAIETSLQSDAEQAPAVTVEVDGLP